MTVIIVAHGTCDPAGVAVARCLADRLDARLGGRPVRLAFIDVLRPRLRDVLAEARGPVAVIPAFLASGYHVRADVPREVAAASRRDVTVTGALGPSLLLLGAVRDRLRGAGWRPGDAVVLAAAGSSDPRASAEVRTAASRLAALVDFPVRVGLLAAGQPRADAVVEELRAVGHRRVAIASWLLAPGLFHRKLADMGADTVAAPLGTHPAVLDRLTHLACTPPVPAFWSQTGAIRPRVPAVCLQNAEA